MAMLETAALQPGQQPQWTAADLQLPELGHEAVPMISTKPEVYWGGTFYRIPGTKGTDFGNYTLEPP
eukprot:10857232-Alexandrium_andersonii.AAC.1